MILIPDVDLFAHTCIVCPIFEILYVVLPVFLAHLIEDIWNDVLTQCLAQRLNGGFILFVFGHEGFVSGLESMGHRHPQSFE